MKENHWENRQKIIALLAGDYINEVILKIYDLKKYGVQDLKNAIVQTINERYMEGVNEGDTIDVFLKRQIPLEQHELFFQYRNQLDNIVKDLNSELRKENPNDVQVKRYFNEIMLICKNTKPFPEIEG